MAGVYRFAHDGQLEGADPVLQQHALWATLVGLRHNLNMKIELLFA